MKIPTELIPDCSVCGKPMSMNLRADNTFVQDNGWYQASERYSDFIRRHRGHRVVFFELGVGMNTPTIVKYNFWHMAYEWKDAVYACLNNGEAYATNEIKKKSICINGDIGEIMGQL